VHAQAMGWPILGDPVYGAGRRPDAPPLHLHARALVVPIQDNREPVRTVAPVPAHMRAALGDCGIAPDLPNDGESLTITS